MLHFTPLGSTTTEILFKCRGKFKSLTILREKLAETGCTSKTQMADGVKFYKENVKNLNNGNHADQ